MENWFLRVYGAVQDLTQAAGIGRFLRNTLTIPDYGTKYRLYSNDQVLDLNQAKNVLIDAVLKSTKFEEYFNRLARSIQRGDRPDNMYVGIEYQDTGQLMFEHSDVIQFPLHVNGDITIRGPGNLTTRRQRRIDEQTEQQREALERKLERTQNTDSTTYLQHANHCGYLLKNTAFRLYFLGNSYGPGIMTYIKNLDLEQLHGLVDSTGYTSLSGLSRFVTIDDSESSMTTSRNAVVATNQNFAREIINFLNLEFVIDINQLFYECHRGSDSGLKGMAYWGADVETTLNKLKERRKDIDPAEIEEYFRAGHEGTLL